MPGWMILVNILIFAVFIAIAIRSYYAREQRIEAFKLVAQRLGWRFSEYKDRDHDEQYSHFEIFRRGHSRAAYDTLSGSLTVFGQSCFAKAGDFTYKVTSGSGKNRSTHTYHFSYLIIELPFHGIPDVLARRENLFDKFTDMLGFDDIDFESSEFSKKFCIKSPDKRFAYDLFTPRMMEFFLEGSPVPGLPAIDMENSRICLSNGRSIWKPEQFEQAIAWAEQFFENWPEHLLETLRERSGIHSAP